MSHVVEAAGPVGGANHFEAEGRSEVPDLQQHECQILDEQQRVHQRDGVSHDAPVVTLSGLQHPDAVEEPVRGHEEEDQRHQQAAEDEEAWQRGAGRPQEQGPGRDEQHQKLEGQRDVEALAGGPAGLQRVTPQQLRQQEEGQRRQEREQTQNTAQDGPCEATALQRRRVLQLFRRPRQVLIRHAVLGRPGHDGGGLAPVIILRGDQERSCEWCWEERWRLKYECFSSYDIRWCSWVTSTAVFVN